MKKIKIASLTLFAVIAAATAVLFLDPFNWHLPDRFDDEYDAAMTAIPADSLVYIGVNLLHYDADEWKTIQQAEDGGMMEDLDEVIFYETGLHLADELPLWMGQYAGAAILPLTGSADELTNLEWLLAAEVRDKKAADIFLQKLSGGWGQRQGSVPHESNGIIWFDGIAFGRNGRLLLVGSSLTAVEQGIAAMEGKSLADDPDYADAIASLPAKRLLTGYVPAAALPVSTSALPYQFMGAGAGNLLPNGMGGTAVSMNSNAEGIQVDTVTVYDFEQMDRAEKEALATVGESHAAEILPANTLVYMTGQPIALSWPPLRDRLATAVGEADFEETIELFDDSFGLNLDTELFPLLTGGTAVALLDDLSPIAVLESGDMTKVETAVLQFNTTVTNNGLGRVDEVDDVYGFTTFFMPDLIFNYALTDEALLFSNSLAPLAKIPADDTLADLPRFQKAAAVFPDMNHDLYIDLQNIDAAMLLHILMITGGTAVQENIVHHRLLIFTE